MYFLPQKMSSVLNYIKNNPQETQRLVGLKSEHLEQLIKQPSLYIPKSNRNSGRKVRIIKKGGGRKVKLSIEEQIP